MTAMFKIQKFDWVVVIDTVALRLKFQLVHPGKYFANQLFRQQY